MTARADDTITGLTGGARRPGSADASFDLPKGKEDKYGSLEPGQMRAAKAGERHDRNLYEHGLKRGRRLGDPAGSGPIPAAPDGMSHSEESTFKSGEEDGRRQASDKAKGANRSARRRAVGKAGNKVRRQVTRHSPGIAGTATQLWHVAVVSLVMVALYVALTHAAGVGSVITGLQKAVAWLISPTATI